MTTIPEQFGPYRVKKLLGGGGMGAVYLVENTKLEREEAAQDPPLRVRQRPGGEKAFPRRGYPSSFLGGVRAVREWARPV